MTIPEIKEMFVVVIQEKGIYNKIQGITRNDVYNWLNGRKNPTVGEMMFVLFQLGYIEITQKKPLEVPRFKNVVKKPIEIKQ